MTSNLSKRWSLLILGIAALLIGADQPPQTLTSSERLAQMSPAEKAELTKKKTRFENLPLEEQTRIRKLHEQLSKHEDQQRLQEVMSRYSAWLTELTSAQRAELRALNPKDRVKLIEEIKLDQAAQQLAAIGPVKLQQEDITLMFRWIGEYIKNHREEIAPELPSDLRKRIQSMPEDAQLRTILFTLNRNPDFRFPPPTEEEIANLEKELSGEAKEALARAEPKLKAQMVNRLLRAAFYSRMTTQFSEDELQKFASKHLTSEQREQLEGLPREEMQRKLRQMYMAHRFQRSSGGRGPAPWRGSGGPPRRPGGGPPHGGPRHGQGDRPRRPMGEHRKDTDRRPPENRQQENVRPS